jgi:hypothetical protein
MQNLIIAISSVLWHATALARAPHSQKLQHIVLNTLERDEKLAGITCITPFSLHITVASCWRHVEKIKIEIIINYFIFS